MSLIFNNNTASTIFSTTTARTNNTADPHVSRCTHIVAIKCIIKQIGNLLLPTQSQNAVLASTSFTFPSFCAVMWKSPSNKSTMMYSYHTQLSTIFLYLSLLSSLSYISFPLYSFFDNAKRLHAFVFFQQFVDAT